MGTFQFSGQRGYYEFYVNGGSQAIFPVDPISLRLFAFKIPSAQPSGVFQSSLALVTGSTTTASQLNFSGGQVSIQDNGRFRGTGPFPVTFNGGVVQIAAGQCATGTCTGLYSQALNLVYLPEVGGVAFLGSHS